MTNTIKVTWQGQVVETQTRTLAAFLEERGTNSSTVVVEFNGDVFAPGEDFVRVTLSDGDSIAAFQVVAGG